MTNQVKFDGYVFNAKKINDVIYVLASDVRKFIETISYKCLVYEAENMYFEPARKMKGSRIKWVESCIYINWYMILVLTMKYNYEKYEKYKNILESQLGYQYINN